MDVKVGDLVDVPGGMYGLVKFVGSVQGKKGTFVGVDLNQSFWSRGKNNGSVDGKSYFRSSKPTSGIFLPVDKAVRRNGPPTPSTPSLSSFNIGGRTPSTGKTMFSQSVGPGARAVSPAIKPALRRPSLPRPGSPVRSVGPAVSTPARPSTIGLPKSRVGGGPRFTPGPKSFNLSTSLRNGTSTPSKQTPSYEPSFDESPEVERERTPTPTPIPSIPSGNPKGGIDNTIQQEEIKRLKAQLEDKDQQLQEQTSALNDMEKTLTELQSFLPTEDPPLRHTRQPSNEPADVTQLRALLREKNEKISMLTAEFDAHRADFRSTIDTLEMASTETERVYEKRVEELLQEIRELQDRGDDVESVAIQLKQLEELVQELEEGLEDARRGEAEARGEVEHLRGEVERTRTELKHEKDKASQNVKTPPADPNWSARNSKELEAKEDEIRGLKAIIHSLSRDSMLSPSGTVGPPSPGASGHSTDGAERVADLEKQLKDLQNVVYRKSQREEELEKEVERLRTTISLERPPSQVIVSDHRLSDRTVVPIDWRQPNGNRPQLETMQEDARSEVSKSTTLRCELCEEEGHDILNCTNVWPGGAASSKLNGGPLRTGKDVVAEGLKNLSIPTSRDLNGEDTVAPLSPRKSPSITPQAVTAPETNGNDYISVKPVPPIIKAPADEEKWCAVCDSEEHNTMDCPNEDMI